MRALALIALCACTTTMRISRDELQADVAKHFPRDVDKHAVQVRLSDPNVELPGSLFAMRLRIAATSASGRSQVAGTARVEGNLEYVANEHAFYLRAARVTDLVLEPATGDGDAAHTLNRAKATFGDALVARAVRSVIEEMLERRPIYRLDASRPKDAKAIRHLRDARIEDGHLVLEVGL